MAPVIRVVDLSFQYPQASTAALSHVNFEIEGGEVVGLVGPSGAGKSTLCLALKGLIPHVVMGNMWGDVYIHEPNTRSLRVEQLAERVGLVFQDPESQIIGLTVAEDLAFGPENLLVDPEEIRQGIPQALRRVGLAGFERRETYKMSGGQKQRLAIASVLMMHPEILLLDEPTSELDPLGREEVYDTVTQLKHDGTTIVLVDHDVEHLADISDRILLLSGGTLVQDCSIEELFRARDNALLVRPPQVTEVAWALQDAGLVTFDAPPVREADGLRLFSQVLTQRGVSS